MRISFALHSSVSLVFDIVYLFKLTSNRYVMVFYCSFNLQFPNYIWCWKCFHMFIFHLYVFRSFAHFLTGFLFYYCWVLRVLCSFWRKVTYQICVFRYFLLVCGFSFDYLKIVFHRAEVLNFNKYSIFFYGLWFCVVSKISSWSPRSLKFFLFSIRNFIVLWFIF